MFESRRRHHLHYLRYSNIEFPSDCRIDLLLEARRVHPKLPGNRGELDKLQTSLTCLVLGNEGCRLGQSAGQISLSQAGVLSRATMTTTTA